jgi:predicted lipoprotein
MTHSQDPERREGEPEGSQAGFGSRAPAAGASVQDNERRAPLGLLAWIAVAVIVLVVFPPFHIRPLQPAGIAPTAPPGALDVPRFAEQFWTEKLASPAAQPVDARVLVAALRENPAEAANKYGHRAGIGGKAFFYVSGEGQVSAVDRTGVRLNALAPGSTQLVLITGPIFGNALRDATGLLDIKDFNSFDFNALSAELNRLAESRAQPALRRGLTVGSTISFIAAGEFDDASGEEPVLKLVPIRVTPK